MGSVYYISPEQAQEHELHETSDLYSIGIVLYQMLTGTLPYTGESPVTVALRHIGDPVPMIDVARDGVSPALAAIVNRLLQKNPQSRFQSASELATALREARERPSVAGYRIADDAPGQPRTFRRGRLPPRRSPMPDRRVRPIRKKTRARAAGRGLPLPDRSRSSARRRSATYLFARPLPNLRGTASWSSDYTGMTQARSAAGRRECGPAHALHQERERNGPARSRDPAIARCRNEGREELRSSSWSSATASRCVGSTTCADTTSNDAAENPAAGRFRSDARAPLRQHAQGQRDRSDAKARLEGSRRQPGHAGRFRRSRRR